ncbi:MAG: sulfatase-like hydrolase/transferase [Pseudomonadota bacterium]
MEDPDRGELARRDFLKVTTGATAALGLPAIQGAKAAEPTGPYNVILVITDQESHRLLAGADYRLPARDALARRGISFEQHYIAAAMCTPSRGAMFSGQPPQVNGVFDQMELGYVPSLSTERPSLGTVMKELGYATAYYGKFELLRDIITPSDQVNYTDALKAYGFDHFAPDGDKVGAPDQGYDTDTYTAAAAVRWMRTNGRKLNAKGQPWFLVVSFVSPHDIMYADANIGGQRVQASKIGATITPPPDNRLFQADWRFPLSPSHGDAIDGPGRPPAQMQYHLGWSDFLGEIPDDRDDMWRLFYTYYLNLIRDNDRNLQMLLDAFDELDLWRNSVVVRTADHGELAGSHGGLRGKGPFPYEEMAHVPLVIAHPAHSGGQSCRALTSHIDLLPTLVGLTGRPDASRVTGGLPGRDASRLLAGAALAAPDALRPGVLFNYVGLQTVDADYLAYIACKSIVEGRWVPPLAKTHPDLSKRGFIDFTFDGRYKYTRYYAPAAFNRPSTLDEILAHNDIELFDLQADPFERNNLALEPKTNEATILRLNALLNQLIDQEVGIDDGRFLPAPVRPGG